MHKLLVGIVAAMLLAGCTENQRARNFGGTITVTLPPNQKLITATWKADDMWYLTRPFRPLEVPETYTFKESSSFGMIQGTVIFKEVRGN